MWQTAAVQIELQVRLSRRYCAPSMDLLGQDCAPAGPISGPRYERAGESCTCR